MLSDCQIEGFRRECVAITMGAMYVAVDGSFRLVCQSEFFDGASGYEEAVASRVALIHAK